MSPSVGSQLSVAVAIGLALTVPAGADGIHVTKTVRPAVAETTWVSAQHADNFSCWPFTCSDPFADALFEGGIPQLTSPPDGSFVVGFQNAYDPGTDPCNCSWFIAWAYRGVVLFKIDDIPPHFTKATLVLTTGSALSSDPSFNVPFSGIFETSIATPPMFASGGVRSNTADKSVTAVNDAGIFLPIVGDPSLQHALIKNFPPPPYPSAPVLEEKTPFNYRIDVTPSVNNWFADWANRRKTPLRGFILVGRDESLPQTSNSTLLITYEAHLEFDIDEPDR
jgi:hypothetical protein